LIPFFNTPKGKKYVNAVLAGKRYVVVNVDEINDWDSIQALNIVNEAVKFGVESFVEALGEAAHAVNPSINPKHIETEIGFKGKCIPFVKVHSIASEHIGKLIRVKGTVNRTHSIKPMAVQVQFKCRNCNSLTQLIYQESPFVLTSPPKKCEYCEERVTYDIVEELSVYTDSQEFTIQESHEDISGRIPQRISMIIFKKALINKVFCGDIVEIFGMVRLMPTYRRGRKSRFNIPYIEVVSLKKFHKDPENINISVAEEKAIINLSKDPNIYNKLVNSVAPSIYGHRKCKEAGLLAMFGGVTKHKQDITIRGNIHILFIRKDQYASINNPFSIFIFTQCRC
jgi:replicative DNA helicase Mcm